MTENVDQSFDSNLLDLFAVEIENQTSLLYKGLIEYEQQKEDGQKLDSLMRAAHSLKGAARVVKMEPVIKLAHAMEDCFVAAQQKKMALGPGQIDLLLQVTDFLASMKRIPPLSLAGYLEQKKETVASLIQNLQDMRRGDPFVPIPSASSSPFPKIYEEQKLTAKPISSASARRPEEMQNDRDRILRVTASNLNRLMGLAGESLVESRWLYPFCDALAKVKMQHVDLLRNMDQLGEFLEAGSIAESAKDAFDQVIQKGNTCLLSLSERMTELELFIARHSSLSERFYQEVIDSRMRPFADGVEGFPRMVRDLSKELQKRVHFEIVGKSTSVDRDILEKLESPLTHLLRNAVDHGIETPEERVAQGKPPEGRIRLEAAHSAGMLAITVSDDGRGIDLEALRKRIIEKNFVPEEVALKLNDHELLDFLFLPGFSTATHLTEISGRGVGLNAVQNMIQQVSGIVRVKTAPHAGVTFHLLLPLTLSVIRSLLVEIAGEPYAFPLASIESSLLISREDIEVIENRQFFQFEGMNIGLVPAWQVLGLPEVRQSASEISVVVLSDRAHLYGLAVDRFIGQKEIVVQELDKRLGKVSDISAGAFMEDGSPLLIIDVEDMVRSIDLLLSGGRLEQVHYADHVLTDKSKKRILIVDDSVTVREVESRLLRNHGYEVETAVNGADGWNAVRVGKYDLIVTDVDMPRMNGLEFVKAIRNDPHLKNLPVIIVSYKEREEDRQAGLEAGANCYLTKSSFHDKSLINGIKELIGN